MEACQCAAAALETSLHLPRPPRQGLRTQAGGGWSKAAAANVGMMVRCSVPQGGVVVRAASTSLSPAVAQKTAEAEKVVVSQEESSIPVLSLSEVSAKLASNVHDEARETFKAMYSSWIGGITTDPAAMVIPMDDHMVHRGHGVFDTALLVDGYLYELDAHLDRFLTSAAKARITLPFDRATIRDILIQTTAVSNSRNGLLRYWLSVGPGNFVLSPSRCVRPTLYAIVVEETEKHVEQVNVITTSVPIKPPEFATVKSVNYLPNALAKMEAIDRNTEAGIWLDEEGFVAEGPNMNVAFVNSSGVLLVPSFDKILAGCTAKRMLALATDFLSKQGSQAPAAGPHSNGAGLLTGIRMGNITVEEARACPEMMLVGSGVLIMPVTHWDGQPVGDGTPGKVSKFLLQILKDDMISPSSQLTPVPFKS